MPQLDFLCWNQWPWRPPGQYRVNIWQLWHPVPVVSRVALDLPYWVMRSAPYCLIRMAIEMAREAGPFFSVVYFISCITVAKRPSYGLLKIKPSYTTVCHYVYIQFIYYGDPPTPIAMNAVLAIIASGGRAIIVIYREGVEINYCLLYFIDSTKNLQRRPRSTLSM